MIKIIQTKTPVVVDREQSWKNPQKGDLASSFFSLSREQRRKDKLKIHQSLESRNLVIRKFSDRSTGSWDRNWEPSPIVSTF